MIFSTRKLTDAKHLPALRIASGSSIAQSNFAAAQDVRTVAPAINYSTGDSFRSGFKINSSKVIDRFAEEIPTTGLPSPSDIRSTLEAVRADSYDAAVFVTISSGLSATNHTMHRDRKDRAYSRSSSARRPEPRRRGRPAAQRLVTPRAPSLRRSNRTETSLVGEQNGVQRSTDYSSKSFTCGNANLKTPDNR